MWGFGDSLLGVKANAEPPKQLLPEQLCPQRAGGHSLGARLGCPWGLRGHTPTLLLLGLE